MARTETFYNMGFRLTYPDVFDHPRGLLSPMEIGDMGGRYLFHDVHLYCGNGRGYQSDAR